MIRNAIINMASAVRIINIRNEFYMGDDGLISGFLSLLFKKR